MDDFCCLICCRSLESFSIGECRHRVACDHCTIRMRTLYRDSNCPLCKQHLSQVVITCDLEMLFDDFDLRTLIYDSTWDMYFSEAERYEQLLRLYRLLFCPICADEEPFEKVASWQQHLTHQHNISVCEVCIESEKFFPSELRLYTQDNLQKHVCNGDNHPDGLMEGQEDSPEITVVHGHPECKFCLKRFFGKDELYTHLTKSHYTCSICETFDIRFQYYRDYDDLEEHWKECHFPCRESECVAQKFVVFENEIELRSHYLQSHSSKLSQRAKKQMRNLLAAGGAPSLPPVIQPTSRGQQILWDNLKAVSTSEKATYLPVTSMGFVAEILQQQNVEEEMEHKTQRLVRVLKLCLGHNAERFDIFHNLSLQFRSGALPAEEYYGHIQEIFQKKADIVFPLLVVTIPEDGLRRKLQEVHDFHSHGSNASKPKPRIETGSSSAGQSSQPDEQEILAVQSYFYFFVLSNFISSGIPEDVDQIFPMAHYEFDSMQRMLQDLKLGEALAFRLIDLFNTTPTICKVMEDVLVVYEETCAQGVEGIFHHLQALNIFDLHRVVIYCSIMCERILSQLGKELNPSLNFVDMGIPQETQDFESAFPELGAAVSSKIPKKIDTTRPLPLLVRTMKAAKNAPTLLDFVPHFLRDDHHSDYYDTPYNYDYSNYDGEHQHNGHPSQRPVLQIEVPKVSEPITLRSSTTKSKPKDEAIPAGAANPEKKMPAPLVEKKSDNKPAPKSSAIKSSAKAPLKIEDVPQPWTAAEQKLLEQGLREISKDDPMRWERISAIVGTRGKKECMDRYKSIVQLLKKTSKPG